MNPSYRGVDTPSRTLCLIFVSLGVAWWIMVALLIQWRGKP